MSSGECECTFILLKGGAFSVAHACWCRCNKTIRRLLEAKFSGELASVSLKIFTNPVDENEVRNCIVKHMYVGTSTLMSSKMFGVHVRADTIPLQ